MRRSAHLVAALSTLEGKGPSTGRRPRRLRTRQRAKQSTDRHHANKAAAEPAYMTGGGHLVPATGPSLS